MSNKLVLSFLLGASVCCLSARSRASSSQMSDSSFLAMAAQADMTMAHIGQMAEERGANGKVKEFAKSLVQDHTNDYRSLSDVAMKTGDSIPKAIDKKNEITISALDRYKGKAFDHAFLERQSAEHEKLITAFKHEAEHGSNPAIKDYANKSLPTIERHLHDAQDLLKKHS